MFSFRSLRDASRTDVGRCAVSGQHTSPASRFRLYILHTAVSVKQNKCPGEVAARFDEANDPRARDWRSSTGAQQLERYPEAQGASSYVQA
jgi:hypothetical protein